MDLREAPRSLEGTIAGAMGPHGEPVFSTRRCRDIGARDRLSTGRAHLGAPRPGHRRRSRARAAPAVEPATNDSAQTDVEALLQSHLFGEADKAPPLRSPRASRTPPDTTLSLDLRGNPVERRCGSERPGDHRGEPRRGQDLPREPGRSITRAERSFTAVVLGQSAARPRRRPVRDLAAAEGTARRRGAARADAR